MRLNRFLTSIATAVVAGTLVLPATAPAAAAESASQPTAAPATSAPALPSPKAEPASPPTVEATTPEPTAAAAAATSDPSTSAPPLAQQDDSGDHVMGASIRAHEGTTARARSLAVTPRVASSSYVPGMDVSAWQPNVNWAGDYGNGARFAYIKATEGVSYRSSTFSSQYAGAYKAGMIRGAYVYAQPSTASGVDTANYFFANGGKWSPDGKTLPPLLDIEYGSAAQGTCYGMSASAMVNWISSFTNRMHTLTGVWPAIYTTTNWWTTCTGNSAAFGQNPYFVARYTTASTPGTLGASWGSWTMWQWASSGVFAGDQDVFNGTLAQLQAFAAGTTRVSTAPVTRVAGADAYGTSAALSSSQYKPGVSKVFIATRQNFPDALAGAAAAGKAGGPVLLSGRTTLASTVLAELARLQPKQIVVIGGPAAIDDAVLKKLRTATSGPVTREFGDDRFATAAAVATSNWGTSASTVYVATGSNYPDAVAASAIAAATKTSGPVLLTTPKTLSTATQAAIKTLRPSKVVILGGTSAISTQTQQMITSTLNGLGRGTVVRLAGDDRFETASVVARSAYSTASTVYLATGRGFPDALAGGPVAAQRSAPMLLVNPNSIPPATREAILQMKPSRIVIVGGPAAVSNKVAALL